MNICVLIPAFNESRTIFNLVKDIAVQGFDVFVVNDGSTDDTGDLAQEAGATVVNVNLRRGKGATLRSGFDVLVQKKYDAVILVDGDGQHSPKDLKQFVAVADQYDLITGNRLNNADGMPLVRYCTNRIMSIILSVIGGFNITDTQCGMRMLRISLLKKMTLQALSFEIESEMLMQAAKLNARIGEVDVQTIYGEEESKVDPVKDTIRFLQFLFKEMTQKS